METFLERKGVTENDCLPKLACSRSQNLGNKSQVFSHWMGWICLVQLLKYFRKKSVEYCNARVSWLGSGLISIKRQKQRTKAEVKSRVSIFFFSECTEAKTHHHLGQQEQRRGCFVLATQEPASFPVDQSSSLPCYLFILSATHHIFDSITNSPKLQQAKQIRYSVWCADNKSKKSSHELTSK